jgi:hypothetical protein
MKRYPNVYDCNLKDAIPNEKMQIALSRTKTLKYILTRAAVKLPQHLDIENIKKQGLLDDTSKP